eukprot:jgi/Tetstr1/460097/TSEL_005414.t1
MHIDSYGYGWVAVLNETTEARGFRYDGDRELHITCYKELKAVRRYAVLTFLSELRGRQVLHEDNIWRSSGGGDTSDSSGELPLRSNVDMLNKRVDKLDKNVEWLQVQLEAERCMEQCNMEIKEGFRKGSNHQPQRLLKTGKVTLGKTGQVMKRSTLTAHHHDMHHHDQPIMHIPTSHSFRARYSRSSLASSL